MSTIATPDIAADAEGVAQNFNLSDSRKAPLSLNIVIVGCGIGGLAAAHCLTQAGHKVTMYESASFVGEVGAGIQVSPNVTRLLIRWGVEEQLKKIAVRPESVVFRRYNSGERVGFTRWGDQMNLKYGAPYYHIHRADFHKLLYDLARPNVTLHLKSTVVAVDESVPSITLQSGEVVKCDLLIGADGVKSFVQQAVIGHVNPATPTGDAAYRALIPTSFLLADPELRPFVDTPEMSGWMAPGRHLMAYCIRDKQEFNLVMLRPDDSDESVESWTAEGNADRMRAQFADFEPRIQKMLGQVKSTLSWRLMDRQPLDTWISPSGKVALLGDACHPMLPYRAQGAAMAIEDAAVLGNLFSHISHVSQIQPLLQAYQDLRLPRASETQAQSRLNQKIFHLPDGPEQEARDANMRKAMEMELRLVRGEEVEDVTLGNFNQWADQTKSAIQYSYDADKVAEDWWHNTGKYTIASLAVQPDSKL
ncbi:hypothetical protein EIP91_012007 [Steccherinum ochraceum]|uniref:FAD-binding domain-containing protein n=1 Tax=Steccherinum ochraceum TaxID=92696 RepID=A0A4R0RGX5_9APHY|nr:hypothetical protein EIP91_012007 [Steccherinum ochraceum]